MNNQADHIDDDAHKRPVFLREMETLRDLRVLEAVETDPGASQRMLARELGVAVGVVNACLRSLVRKGLVKIRGENNRSITYHLTREGVLRKAMLSVVWTRNTLGFYRTTRAAVSTWMAELQASGHAKAVLYGANELAEIVVLVSVGTGLTILAAHVGNEPALGDYLVSVPVRPVPVEERLSVDLVVLVEEVDDETARMLSSCYPYAEFASLLGQEIGVK